MNGDNTQAQETDKTKLPTVGDLPRPSFRAQLDHWLLGLVDASLQGGAVAVKAFAGAACASALSGSAIPALSLSQAGAVFLSGAVYHFNDYLDTHRLPGVASSPEPTK